MVENSAYRDFFEAFDSEAEMVMGDILDKDLSSAHIVEDPLIKNFAEANHFLDHNMTKRSTKLYLNLKFFFKKLFGRKKEKVAKVKKSAKKAAKKTSRKR